MNHNTPKLISIILALALLWQQAGWAEAPRLRGTSADGVAMLKPRSYSERREGDPQPRLLTLEEFYRLQESADGSKESMAACLSQIREGLRAIDILVKRLKIPAGVLRDFEEITIRSDPGLSLYPNMEEASNLVAERIDWLLSCYDKMGRQKEDPALKVSERNCIVLCTDYATLVQKFLIYLAYAGLTQKFGGDETKCLFGIYKAAMQINYIVRYPLHYNLGMEPPRPGLFPEGFSTRDITVGISLNNFVDVLTKRLCDHLASTETQPPVKEELPRLEQKLDINVQLPRPPIFLPKTSMHTLYLLVVEGWKNAVGNFFGMKARGGAEAQQISVTLQYENGKAKLAFANNRVVFNRRELSMIFLPGVTNKRTMQKERVLKDDPNIDGIYGGYGLGLTKVLYVASIIGGEVEAYARALDGKTYRVVCKNGLPLVEEAAASEIPYTTGFKLVITIPKAFSRVGPDALNTLYLSQI